MEPRIFKYTNWDMGFGSCHLNCKLTPLLSMDLRAINIWNQDLASTRGEILGLNPNIRVCISFLKVCLLTVESTWCCSWRLHVTVLLSDCHISTYINDILRIYGCTWLYKPVRVNFYWHQKMLWVRHRAETIAFVYRWIMITNAIVLININVFFLEG